MTDETQPLLPDTPPPHMIALYTALAKAQGAFEPIVKNREVTIELKDDNFKKIGSYKFRYADLEEINSKTRPALSANGLSILQPIRQAGASLVLETLLMHAEGGVISSVVTIPTGHKDIKKLGASITYQRRYQLSSLLNIAADDDLDENGEEASDDAPQAANDNRPAQDSRDAPGRDDGQPETYEQAKFDKNLPAWSEMILSGKKTAAGLIAFVESKTPMTAAQKKTLNSIQPIGAENAQ